MSRVSRMGGHISRGSLDCQDPDIAGNAFAWRGRAKEAEPSIEAACLARFVTIRPQERLRFCAMKMA
jgi:hypothetical protein